MVDYFVQEVKRGLQANQMDLPVSSQVMTIFLQMDAYQIDYEKIRHLENREFFQALFICLFKRLPERENYETFDQAIKELDRDAFQKRAVFALARSMECKDKKTCVVNYPPLLEEGVPTGSKMQMIGMYVYNRCHFIYMRLPLGVRRILKKLLKKVLLPRA